MKHYSAIAQSLECLLRQTCRTETQDVILRDIEAERIVEIGPSNILTNMMKRTRDGHFVESDQARNINRRILGPQRDLPEIYYEAETTEETVVSETGNNLSTQTPSAGVPTSEAAQSTGVSQSIPTPGNSRGPAEELPEADVPVLSIVLGILAPKLKKSPKDIQTTGTISSLVGGRSTLSNEIVGDLLAEFPSGVPDRPEEVPLGALCQTLSLNHQGRLGKTTTSMVAKMISSKLPGDYGQSRVRQILLEKWGLGPKRQDAVLLLALTKQPSSRISASDDANKFLDEASAAYFQKEGLILPSGGPVQTHATVIDEKALELVKEQNDSLVRDVLEVLNRHLKDPKEVTKATETRSEVAAAIATKKLDVWLSEHGDDYAEGIVSMFDAKKQRVYDSYWNWNSQDVALLFELQRHPRSEDIKLLEQLSMSIVNRACDRTIVQLEYLISKTATKGSDKADLVQALRLLSKACEDSMNRDSLFINLAPDLAPLTTIEGKGNLVFSEIVRNTGSSKVETTNRARTICEPIFPVSYFHAGVSRHSHEHSLAFARDLQVSRHSGFSFSRRNVLLTGAGRNSIGNHILRHLLAGGARVTVTTSRYSAETTDMYQKIYARHGSRGSVLRVVPFNQGSQRDVEELIKHMYEDASWDLDFIVPFAAMSENGRGVEDLDSRSEIAHRAMLTNLLRLLGAVARNKRSRGILTRPATVILPLSPNHGLMGNDGLYSESKRSLEALLPKWASESWGEYLSLFGVVIGWTRGTGLMDDNDVVAQAVEALGVQTFASAEMAANIVSLMGGSLNAECQSGPILVDMGGGLGNVQGFKDKLTKIRRELYAYADLQRIITEERRRDAACVSGRDATSQITKTEPLAARANIQLPLPALPDYEKLIGPLASSMEGMVDLSRVVVITGFSELGPYGNSRTRWEMEASGTLSLEGCVEMSWLMGLIKHHSGVGKDGKQFTGWVDTKTLVPVTEADIPAKYLSAIVEHTGIRKIEPENCDNSYDPEHKESLQEVSLQRDLPAFETSPESAEDLRRQHGNKVAITRDASGGCHVQIKAGATLMLPRSSRYNRTVAGQIPAGWTAKRYGITDDIIEQVDPVTLFSLVCTVEALLCSGIIDPYEWYQHIHVSEVGNCLGSSMGGLSSLRKMHRDRYIDKPVKGDILQETFINTTGAWINMLLTSSAGPIRTPVGACATSLESLDTGCDLIMAKKAKVCLIGGVEDFVEDVSFEFGSMKATCDTDAEFAAGRTPREMSRPTASSRSGFVESQGCGIQVLTSAELALEMGLPIFGIVAYANMTADKAGRSVPAPGKGVLTNARELSPTTSSVPSPLLDMNYRRRLLGLRRHHIEQDTQDRLGILESEMAYLKESSIGDVERYRNERTTMIQEEARRQDAEITFSLGNNFWRSQETQRISPIRGSLAVWGLSIDDISVASLHGTSTVKNDLNEPMVIQEQMRHLGRRPGNILPCVCQKWLTGHSKGAAGAWMINGCLQMMDTGLIPGNRNADNVDEGLREHQHLLFPNSKLQADPEEGIKACSITSFGFGQKGAQAILVHPRYLFATITRDRYVEYAQKRDKRWQRACRRLSEAMVQDNMVSTCIKNQPPYASSDEVGVLLDPGARF
ncbi:hypothetical protein FZEAL_6641 [Fusarium zealandicum]|uniref:beta-ketoacyl-[acyl-carrier-protein] synthase I n=1 Tax=Fusarium zealandicum TaxID=1053134 RepID=A0A8H4XJE7_9HYPO|nr:hypothetical protein FZEAL_6641 [Fusarium zealandicum]